MKYSFGQIKERLIEMAIDGALPMDFNELEECELFPDRQAAIHSAMVENLGHYISTQGTVEDCLRQLISQSEEDGSIPADDIVTMWEPLQDRYTVDELLEQIEPVE